jgi:hypothetical protein
VYRTRRPKEARKVEIPAPTSRQNSAQLLPDIENNGAEKSASRLARREQGTAAPITIEAPMVRISEISLMTHICNFLLNVSLLSNYYNKQKLRN